MTRLTSILLAGAVALGAVSCASDGRESRRAASDTSTSLTTPVVPLVVEGDRYVALGSSIASGFGIAVQSTDCGRSSRSYPNLVAAEFGLALTDVSCGAATIPNIVDTPQGARPPQIVSIPADTKLITVTVGGNDIGYNATALVCSNPQTECEPPASLDASVAAAATALEGMIEKLEAVAPAATIVLVTYPMEVPAANCPALSLTDDEASLVRDMGAKLEAMFLEVARGADVILVDPYSVQGDHTGCAPESERWTAGAVAEDGVAFHPTALGHEVMAAMISYVLTGAN